MWLCFRRARHFGTASAAGLPLGPAGGSRWAGDANLVAGGERIRRAVDHPVRHRQAFDNFDLGAEIAAERDRLEPPDVSPGAMVATSMPRSRKMSALVGIRSVVGLSARLKRDLRECARLQLGRRCRHEARPARSAPSC